MKTLIAAIQVLALGLLITSCHTIEVINNSGGAQMHEPLQTSWNHTGIFGLVNYSDDYYTAKLCQDSNWHKIITERGGLQLASELGMSLTSSVLVATEKAGTVALGHAVGIANFLWDPLTVRWSCAN